MIDLFFPFGKKLTKVQQEDQDFNKKIFVLGVYASAVHATWIGADGKEKIRAMAVASEPSIFWRGDKTEAKEIITSISEKIPKELGRLEFPANGSMNGPSGKALDELFLAPFGLKREEAWLCDLLPESRVNPGQRRALDKYYSKEIIEEYNLAPASIPDFDENEIKKKSKERNQEILKELESSGAKTIMLLGDLPIRWFLNFFDPRFRRLSDFGDTKENYGRPQEIKINSRMYSVVAVCHPRNAARLGNYSPKWQELHDNWIKKQFNNN